MIYCEKHKVEVDIFVKSCRRVSDLRYVTDHGGNLAWRIEDDVALITPTMSSKEKDDVK